jgi:hypothetical protein
MAAACWLQDHQESRSITGRPVAAQIASMRSTPAETLTNPLLGLSNNRLPRSFNSR